MTNKLLDTLLRLMIASLLIIACYSSQNHNYYVLLRWVIFSSSIYWAYKTKQTSILAFILSVALGILFNPIMPFHFPKSIWTMIDMIVGIFLLIRIDWKELKQGKGKTNA